MGRNGENRFAAGGRWRESCLGRGIRPAVHLRPCGQNRADSGRNVGEICRHSIGGRACGSNVAVTGDASYMSYMRKAGAAANERAAHHGFMMRRPCDGMGATRPGDQRNPSSSLASSLIISLSQGGSKTSETLTALTPGILATCMLMSSTSMSAIGQFGAVRVIWMLTVPSGV